MLVPDAWNDVTRRIIGCAMEVHSHLGPGLAEKLYEDALVYELRVAGLDFQQQHPVRVRYKEALLPEQRLDLLVEDLVVVELKATDGIADVHLAQLLSYMRSADVPLGLLINFNVEALKHGIRRRIFADAVRARLKPAQ